MLLFVRPRRTREDPGTAACTVQPKVSLSTPVTARARGPGLHKQASMPASRRRATPPRTLAAARRCSATGRSWWQAGSRA
jgi:hypothetical protein